MSKAFTSEETEDASIPGRAIARARPGEERPITAEGHRALVSRRDAWIAERAALGADDDRAKELDHRIALAEATLESVRIAPTPPPDGTVRFGSVVVLRWDDGRVQTVTIVGPDEADGDRVSIASPLGRALLDARVGSIVEIERPRGTAEAEIEAIATGVPP